jgi:hypothetical protein
MIRFTNWEIKMRLRKSLSRNTFRPTTAVFVGTHCSSLMGGVSSMDQSTSAGAYSGNVETSRNREAHSSGVSWAAVIAGAFVTAALSLTLLALGAGFGLLSSSPWSARALSRSPLDAAAIIWMIVIQIIACAIGGYLAGRLRTKWAAIHTDEVYFRDTAHGFLVWAVAVVITAGFLGSAATAMVGGVGLDTNGVAGNAYLEGRLVRPGPATATAPGITEPGRSPADMSVNELVEQQRQAAEAARKETGRFLLWTFVALLVGAFCASYAATIGGRQRDHLTAI